MLKCAHGVRVGCIFGCRVLDVEEEEAKPRYGRWEGPAFGGRWIPGREADPGRNLGVCNFRPVVDGQEPLKNYPNKTYIPVYKLNAAGTDFEFDANGEMVVERYDELTPALADLTNPEMYEQRRELPDGEESSTIFAFGRPGGPISEGERRARGVRNAERDAIRLAREAVPPEMKLRTRIRGWVDRARAWMKGAS